MRQAAFIACIFLAASMPGLTSAASPGIRQIAPEVVAPPAVDPGALSREAPRAPLSDLGTAAKPKPKTKGRNGGTLFSPLAVEAGIVEAAGLTVTIAGIDVVRSTETCHAQGEDWACGLRARTAFRGFLRGRALDCDLPPEVLEGAVTAACTIGGKDVGGWLMSNGWARAAAQGPYVQAGVEAQKGAKGIFGPPPPAMDPALAAPAPFSAPAGDQPVLVMPGENADPGDAGSAQTVVPPSQGLY